MSSSNRPPYNEAWYPPTPPRPRRAETPSVDSLPGYGRPGLVAPQPTRAYNPVFPVPQADRARTSMGHRDAAPVSGRRGVFPPHVFQGYHQGSPPPSQSPSSSVASPPTTTQSNLVRSDASIRSSNSTVMDRPTSIGRETEYGHSGIDAVRELLQVQVDENAVLRDQLAQRDRDFRQRERQYQEHIRALNEQLAERERLLAEMETQLRERERVHADMMRRQAEEIAWRDRDRASLETINKIHSNLRKSSR